MGTKTAGNTTLDAHYSATWGYTGESIIGSSDITMPENGYVDTITIYCGGNSGNISLASSLLNSSLNTVLCTIGPNTFGTVNWKTQGLTAGNYYYLASGTQVRIEATGSANPITFGFRSTGNNYAKTGSTSPQPMNTGTTANQFTPGDMNCYFSYFPTATFTSFSPTVGGAGTTVTMTGRSFSAGVTGVSFNGTAATTVNYINDTTINAVVPAGATTGTITITTNAGNATSSSVFTVAGAYVMRSGTWTPTQGVYVMRSGTWTQVTGVYVMRSGTWTSTQ